MRFVRLVVVCVALCGTYAIAGGTLGGCGSGGDKCDSCESDEDCDEGFTCELFTDGVSRCAGSGDKCRRLF